MKLICTKDNLRAGLAIAGKIISPTNTLPVLSNLLLKTENGQLTIISTNLEIAIVTQVRCKVEEEGGVTVSGKMLSDLVNNLPNNNITIKTEDNQLKLECLGYHTNIKTLPIDDFPLIPSVEEGKKITVDAGKFKQALDSVVFAVSTNQTQSEITGVLISGDSGKIRVVATDRYRLAEKSIDCDVLGEVEAIIPHKTCLEVSRIASGKTGNVELVIAGTQVLVVLGETQIISRLMDGQYPDYRQVIPQDFSTTMELKKDEFLNALKTAAVFSKNNNSVNLELSVAEKKLFISSESADLGDSRIELEGDLVGAGGKVMLNYRYLSECLAVVGSEKVLLKVIDDGSPSLITPADNKDYLYLVMPIKS